MADVVLCDPRLFLLKTVLSDINLGPVNSEMTVEDTNTPTKKDNPKKSVRSEGSSQTGQTKNNNMTPSSSASANSNLSKKKWTKFSSYFPP